MLPEALELAIGEEVAGFDLKALSKASKELSERYRFREKFSGPFMKSLDDRKAYAISRMPATFSALQKILSEVSGLVKNVKIKTLLDLGAGPGTAMWAVSDCFEELEKITLVEQDVELSQLGQRLASKSSKAALRVANWIKMNVETAEQFERHDIVTLSYMIGELSAAEPTNLIKNAWNAAQHLLVVVEPGTMHGFEGIKRVRQELLEMGANIIAPCPHQGECPMQKGDWCHFSKRLEGSFMQRYVKDATMGFEDEKFSYIVASKEPVEAYRARILRHPMHHSGHTCFELCTADGIKKETISRKHGALYKQARHFEWGDKIPLD